MAAVGEHYCTCGAWASVGFTPPTGGATIWRCGMDANRMPRCKAQPIEPVVEDSDWAGLAKPSLYGRR